MPPSIIAFLLSPHIDASSRYRRVTINYRSYFKKPSLALYFPFDYVRKMPRPLSCKIWPMLTFFIIRAIDFPALSIASPILHGRIISFAVDTAADDDITPLSQF